MWGDNWPDPPQEVLDRIGDVDIAFIPVDGSGHILDYEQADAVIAMSGANIAIPHHYLVAETTFVTSSLDTALEWTQTHEHTLLEGSAIEVSPADVEGRSGHVYYFDSNNVVTEMAQDG